MKFPGADIKAVFEYKNSLIVIAQVFRASHSPTRRLHQSGGHLVQRRAGSSMRRARLRGLDVIYVVDAFVKQAIERYAALREDRPSYRERQRPNQGFCKLHVYLLDRARWANDEIVFMGRLLVLAIG